MKNLNYLAERYSVSDIQGYFGYITKNHETFTDNPTIRVYINKIKNKIIFRIKTVYFLKHSTPEMMKLLARIKVRQLKMKLLK